MFLHANEFNDVNLNGNHLWRVHEPYILRKILSGSETHAYTSFIGLIFIGTVICDKSFNIQIED